MRITAHEFQSLYQQTPDKELFLKNAQVAQLEVMPDLDMRTALYHHEKGRKFRPSRTEADSGKFRCPYCTTSLQKVRLRSNEHGFTCPRCRWSIHRDDIFDPKEKQVPEVREPGDATGPELQQQNDEEPVDLSMGEVISGVRQSDKGHDGYTG
jgi:hypothetical protein